jgi:hypothetical protein
MAPLALMHAYLLLCLQHPRQLRLKGLPLRVIILIILFWWGCNSSSLRLHCLCLLAPCCCSTPRWRWGRKEVRIPILIIPATTPVVVVKPSWPRLPVKAPVKPSVEPPWRWGWGWTNVVTPPRPVSVVRTSATHEVILFFIHRRGLPIVSVSRPAITIVTRSVPAVVVRATIAVIIMMITANPMEEREKTRTRT